MSAIPVPREDNIDKYILKRKPTEYKTDLGVIKEYINQNTNIVSKYFNITKKEAKKYIIKTINHADILDPIVKYNGRDENDDMIVKEDKLTDYLSDVIADGDVIVPSFTTYVHPTVKKSLHAEFLNINIKERKKDKKLAFDYKQTGDLVKHYYHDTLQKVRKIFNNSLSGAYASKSTSLVNPPAHYSLTSITRSITSIGNAVTESVVAGNKYFKDPHVTMSYITAVIANANIDDIKYAVYRYKIYLPTTDEVYDSLFYSFKHYWRDSLYEYKIKQALNALDPYELAAVMYTNDLWHLKEYNDSLVRNLVNNLSKKRYTGSTSPIKDITNGPEGIDNLVHCIFTDELRGKKIDYKKMQQEDPELIYGLGSTALGIAIDLKIYKPLFRAFYTTDVLPTSIAYIKDSVRDCIVLSDTDSTCGAYDKWNQWYFGKLNFTAEGIGATAVIMTINTQLIDHNIKVFAKNMNIQTNLVELLKMKNEFYWNVFIAANVSKHYYSDTYIQEGNVYKETDLEIKGVHFIGSALEQSIIKGVHQMMKDINKTIVTGNKVSIIEYAEKVSRMEKNIIKRINEQDISIFRLEKIKEASAYKQEKDKSAYLNHILWSDIFKDKYGDPGQPTYMVVKIPTILSKDKDFNKFLDDIEDPVIKDKFIKFTKKYHKKNLGTFRPPMATIETSGIPKEIFPYIDKKRIVTDSLNSAYMVLETIGYYKKPGMTVTESLGYEVKE